MLACIAFWQATGQIDQALNDWHLQGATVSVSICDTEGHVIFERNPQTHLVPASNQKLLSCAFALWSLGPDFRPTTQIWQEPDRTVVETSGDPLLTFAQLQQVAKKLNHRLPIYVKEPYAPGIPPGWDYDDLPNKYAAPISAFTVDRGSYELWADKGRPVLLPNNYGQKIEYRRSNQPLVIRYDPIKKKLKVTGTLPRTRTRLDTLALHKPDAAAASLLGSKFHRTAQVPTRKPDFTIQGSSIAQTLQACLPLSDNNLAEQLLLLGALRQGDLGAKPYEVATQRLKNFLTREVGIQPTDVSPADGSGLGRQNLVTTKAITTLLLWSQKQPTYPLWKSTLAQPGLSTLKTRLNGIKFQGKTGTLKHVASLSGYLQTDSGKELVVSVILNNFTCSESVAKAQIDTFLTTLAHSKFDHSQVQEKILQKNFITKH